MGDIIRINKLKEGKLKKILLGLLVGAVACYFLFGRPLHRTGYRVGWSESEQFIRSQMKVPDSGKVRIGYIIDGEIDPSLTEPVASLVKNFNDELNRAVNFSEVYGRTGDIELLDAKVTGNHEKENILTSWLVEDTQKEKARRTNIMKLKGEGLTPPETRD